MTQKKPRPQKKPATKPAVPQGPLGMTRIGDVLSGIVSPPAKGK